MPAAGLFMERLLGSLHSKAVPKVLNKGEFLLRAGEIERNLYYIESGAVRAFYLSEFEEQTIRLGYEGSIINSLASFLKGTPSEFYLEPIRKTKLLVISKENFFEVVEESEESRQQYSRLLELLITQLIEREIDLLTTSPIERLNRVLLRSPHLFRHIPLKYIASYLRMKPETLSRIRKS